MIINLSCDKKYPTTVPVECHAPPHIFTGEGQRNCNCGQYERLIFQEIMSRKIRDKYSSTSESECASSSDEEEEPKLELTPWELGFIDRFVKSQGECEFYELRRFCRKFQPDKWNDFKDELKKIIGDVELFKRLQKQSKRIISEVSTRLKHSGLKRKSRRYVSFGIGSAGHDPNKTYLSCSEEMKIMRSYAQKHNFYLGSTVEEGTVPCYNAVKERIKYACICAWECKANLVLYYTGHGYEDGDWSFYDGYLSFAHLQGVINDAMQAFGVDELPTSTTTFVVCDSCCSGKWCEFSDHRIRVIASCGAEECTYGDFARVFFKAKLRLTDSEIQHFKVTKLRTLIHMRTGGADDMSLKGGLVTRLKKLEADNRDSVIAGVMKDDPCCSGDRNLTRHDVVHKLWFKNSKAMHGGDLEENIIPEIAYLTINA